MSTVTIREAADALRVHESTVWRRIRLTGVPVEYHANRARIDLDTLEDAWRGHREAVTAERYGTERVTEASITLPLSVRQRQAVEKMSAAEGLPKAPAARRALEIGLRQLGFLED